MDNLTKIRFLHLFVFLFVCLFFYAPSEKGTKGK